MTRRSDFHGPTSTLWFLIWIAGIALLGLFAWQTWEFVNWLFPADEIFYRFLTFACFDVMALIWGCTDMFARILSEKAKWIVRAGWIVTYLLSGIATFLYLAIQGFFRFHLAVTADMYNVGISVSMLALLFNAGIFAAFVNVEGKARAEYKVSHSRYVRRKQRNVTNVTQSNGNVTLRNVTNTSNSNVTQLAQNSSVTPMSNVTAMSNAQRQQRYRQRRKGQFFP